MTRYHQYAEQSHDDGSWERYIVLDSMEECGPDCDYEAEYEPLHVHTDAELRARDEAIINATLRHEIGQDYPDLPSNDVAAILAAAEQGTP